MKIYEELNLNLEKGEVLSFIGGGGKTTTVFQLGKELKELNKKVLITTTTAIFDPEEDTYDYYFIEDIDKDFTPSNGSITVFGEKIKGEKIVSLSLHKIDQIIERKLFDFILIEADGAKGQPIKAPASHEPVITKFTTKTIGIIGLDCLGKKIEDTVHRPEIFIELIGRNFSDIVDEQAIIKLLFNEKGLFKGAKGEKILLLNKAYNEDTILKGKKVRNMLNDEGFKNTVLVADIKRKRFY